MVSLQNLVGRAAIEVSRVGPFKGMPTSILVQSLRVTVMILDEVRSKQSLVINNLLCPPDICHKSTFCFLELPMLSTGCIILENNLLVLWAACVLLEGCAQVW